MKQLRKTTQKKEYRAYDVEKTAYDEYVVYVKDAYGKVLHQEDFDKNDIKDVLIDFARTEYEKKERKERTKKRNKNLADFCKGFAMGFTWFTETFLISYGVSMLYYTIKNRRHL